MAKTVTLTCDICKRSTARIVGKLHYIPMIPGVSRGVHSNYTHHADVGVCCEKKLLKGFNFTRRMTQKEYQEKRKNGGA